jgi:putative redox protein
MEYQFETPILGKIGRGKYQVLLEWRNGKFTADEPVSLGGKDLGPDPFTLLLASLASCTLSTMRMYIDRKGWEIPEISIEVNMFQESTPSFSTTITRNIHFNVEVPDDQKERLLLIAKKCPVSKLLEHSITIQSSI